MTSPFNTFEMSFVIPAVAAASPVIQLYPGTVSGGLYNVAPRLLELEVQLLTAVATDLGFFLLVNDPVFQGAPVTANAVDGTVRVDGPRRPIVVAGGSIPSEPARCPIAISGGGHAWGVAPTNPIGAYEYFRRISLLNSIGNNQTVCWPEGQIPFYSETGFAIAYGPSISVWNLGAGATAQMLVRARWQEVPLDPLP